MRRSLFALLLASSAFGQTVTGPKEVAAPVGRLATVVLQSDGADTKYFADEELDVFREFDKDERVIRLRVIGYTAGKYTLRAITCRDNKLSEPVVVTVVIGGAKPEDPVKPDPPKPDKPAPAEVYYFAVVGAAGPVLPAVATSLKLPAWDELRRAGHVGNYVPVNELSDGLPRPGMLPVVMVLKKDGSKWVDTGSNKPLPTTDEQVRGLLK